MKTNYYVIGRSKVGSVSVDKVQVFGSKWERELDEKITFEGETWYVMSQGYDSRAAAYSMQEVIVLELISSREWAYGETRGVRQF